MLHRTEPIKMKISEKIEMNLNKQFTSILIMENSNIINDSNINNDSNMEDNTLHRFQEQTSHTTMFYTIVDGMSRFKDDPDNFSWGI